MFRVDSDDAICDTGLGSDELNLAHVLCARFVVISESGSYAYDVECHHVLQHYL